MECVKCGNPLTGKQIRFCSPHCSKLYLKSLYRKRNRERINKYNANRRRCGIRTCGADLKKRYLHLKEEECLRCGITTSLEVHHIKPRIFGGTNEANNLMLLCHKCHYEYEQITKKFWYPKMNVKYEIVTVENAVL